MKAEILDLSSHARLMISNPNAFSVGQKKLKNRHAVAILFEETVYHDLLVAFI